MASATVGRSHPSATRPWGQQVRRRRRLVAPRPRRCAIDRTAAILTVSDGVSHGARADDTGREVGERLVSEGFEVVAREVVPDERDQVAAAIRRLAGGARFVVTNGGTGLGPRDVTPEATRAVIDREVPGLAEAMRAVGRAATPMADLSRAVVGVVGRALVVNLPGSPKGALESLDAILGTVPHALDLLAGHTRHGADPAGSRTAADAPAPATAAGDLPADVLIELARRVEAGAEVVLATVVRRDGDPPATLGDKLLIGPSGPLAGTLGCSEFDAGAVADAPGVLAAGGPSSRTYAHDLGSVEVQLEPHGLRDRLVVLGATPIAAWLLRWAPDLGYRTAVVDRRSDRLAEVGGGADVAAATADEVSIDGRTDVVHTDHDAPGLADDVAAALRGGARFIGVIGSGRHAAPYRDELRERGFGDDDLGRIQTPVGFKLGGGAREIALGILAGIVAARRP